MIKIKINKFEEKIQIINEKKRIVYNLFFLWLHGVYIKILEKKYNYLLVNFIDELIFFRFSNNFFRIIIYYKKFVLLIFLISMNEEKF